MIENLKLHLSRPNPLAYRVMSNDRTYDLGVVNIRDSCRRHHENPRTLQKVIAVAIGKFKCHSNWIQTWSRIYWKIRTGYVPTYWLIRKRHTNTKSFIRIWQLLIENNPVVFCSNYLFNTWFFHQNKLDHWMIWKKFFL